MPTKKPTAQQGEASKKLGTIAQKAFGLWCSVADLTANTSEEDDEGWDVFVQAKSSTEPAEFLDQKPPKFSALVQVKGTADPAGGFTMTLANALKLVVDNAGPSFVFTAHLRDDEIQTAWLVHCGEDFIEAALRAAAVKGDSKRLNKTTLTFRPKADEVVQRKTLRAALDATIGDPLKYFDWKRQQVETVGYEGASAALRIRTRASSREEAFEEAADFVLGLRDLSAESADVFDLRFGLKRLKQTIEKPVLSRPLVPSEPDMVISFSTPAGERVELPCQGYLASAFAPFLPPEYNKLRIIAPFLDMTVSREKSRPDTQVLQWSSTELGGPTNATNIAEKARAASVLRLVREPTTILELRRGAAPFLRLPLGGKLVVRDKRAFAYLSALENFETVVRVFGLPISGGDFNKKALLAAAGPLRVLAQIALGAATDATVSFPKTEPPAGVELGASVTFVMGLALRFPKGNVFVVTAVGGKVEDLNEAMYIVRANRLPLLAHQIVPSLEDSTTFAELNKGAGVLVNLGVPNVFIRPFDIEKRRKDDRSFL